MVKFEQGKKKKEKRGNFKHYYYEGVLKISQLNQKTIERKRKKSADWSFRQIF